MKSKYRKPPRRLCDRCGNTFYGWRILCEPCARDLRIREDERESLRDFRRRVIDPKP